RSSQSPPATRRPRPCGLPRSIGMIERAAVPVYRIRTPTPTHRRAATGGPCSRHGTAARPRETPPRAPPWQDLATIAVPASCLMMGHASNDEAPADGRRRVPLAATRSQRRPRLVHDAVRQSVAHLTRTTGPWADEKLAHLTVAQMFEDATHFRRWSSSGRLH